MSPEIFKSEKPVRGVYPLGTIQAIVVAGEEMGIPVVIKAKEGQKYQYLEGGMGVVDKGCAYVEIGTPKREDLGKFWKKVDAIKSLQEQQV